MKKIAPILLLLAIISFSNCNEKACKNEIFFGDFELSATAKSYNPYLPIHKRVVFVDDVGVEYKFEIQDNVLQMESSVAPGPCPEDDSETAFFRSNYTFYRVKLNGLSTNLRFEMWLIERFPQPNEGGITGEEFFIQALDGIVNETALYHRINQFDREGNPISHEDNSEILDSFQLLNKTFYQVIKNSGTSHPKYHVYYNQEFGLIGFKDTVTSKEYVFERIEN